jgi:uncharacterized protein
VHLFYLHGFASSAQSAKAKFFAAKLAPLGLPLHCPDFNEPDFSTLTITRMIHQVESEIAQLPAAPIALIGSSLGAFVAWHAAARQAADIPALPRTHPIEWLVLLAPALDFGANRLRTLGDEGMRKWEETSWLEFFHHGYNEPRRIHYDLYRDAQQYDSLAASVTVPTLVFQGTRDESVDPAMVARFVDARPFMRLHMVDDNHQLLASLEIIWQRTAQFLGLTGQVA